MDQADFKKKNYKEALRKTFFDIDALIGKEDYGTDTGTTACVLFFTDSYIWTVNAGDSRGVLARTDGVCALSEDHKPENTIEIRRIEKAQHYVEDSRVDGNLALSRAFGDFQYKDQKGLKPEE